MKGQTDRQAVDLIHSHTGGQRNVEVGRQTGRQTNRRTDMQIDKDLGRQTKDR
jgi:hypothetical protein